MNLQNSRFEITAVSKEQYPLTGLPEVAFVGRSNVGKSSIINTLLNRKNLAYVGATPGKTKELNFFNIDDTLYMVDLPGYGYASVSKGKITSWNSIIEPYLSSREMLMMIIMLVDVRHEPSSDDKQMHEWLLASGLPYIIAAGKSDKISRSQAARYLGVIRKTLKAPERIKIVPFSAVTGQGKDEIWQEINALLEKVKSAE